MKNQEKLNLQVNKQTIQRLADHYQNRYGVNPLLQTRQRTVLIPRQCLSFILKHKFDVGYSELGRLLGNNHATMMWSEKKVIDALSVYDKQYTDTVNRWAVIFQEIMPEDAAQMWSLQDRVMAMMEATMLNNKGKREILKELLKIYGDDVVNV